MAYKLPTASERVLIKAVEVSRRVCCIAALVADLYGHLWLHLGIDKQINSTELLSEQIFMLYFVEQCEEAPLCLVELFYFDLTGHVSPA